MSSAAAGPDASGEERRVRGPYAKTAEVRRKILESCIDAFGTTGFNGATMKDLAQRAGISQTGLMHHFPTKAELLLGVLGLRDEQAKELAHVGEGTQAAIAGQVDVVRYNATHRGLLQLSTLIAAEGTADHHPAHEITRGRYDNLREYNTGLFRELAEQGALRVDLPPEVLANLFVAVIDGLQVQWLYNPEAVDLVAATESFLSLIIDSEASEKD